ncbi:MAG: hypothetical protein K0S74_57 [Chlamydiales bacterium]|jgi:cell shape-determining protein MreC|nr:hypothetical protein [Chlamydiales bacterium]
MKKSIHFIYLIVFLFSFFLLSLSKSSVEQMRLALTSFWVGSWQSVGLLYGNTTDYLSATQTLAIENQQLKTQIQQIKGLLQQTWYTNQQMLQILNAKSLSRTSALERRLTEQLELVQMHSQSLAAQVIFRNPSVRTHMCWINIGFENNQKIGCEVIAKNSPVVVGNAVVGVVDYVGKEQSRVRLLHDPQLKIAVRVARGFAKYQLLAQQSYVLAQGLHFLDKDDISPKLQEQIKIDLKLLQDSLDGSLAKESVQLAKGVLAGSFYPEWRTWKGVLKGYGFNYDFADEEGPARDLRTGKIIGHTSRAGNVPLIQKNDLLVTTGMDGIFPAGLAVAYVSHVPLLKEGSYSYEIEAVPVIDQLDEISQVFVLPPQNFDLKLEQTITNG